MKRFGLWLAAFALLSQSLALAAPPMDGPSQARAVAADLARQFGANVIVCTDSDGSPAPAHGDCHDLCPLCQVVAGAAALDAPVPTALPARRYVAVATLGVAREDPTPAAPARLKAFARGPPSPT